MKAARIIGQTLNEIIGTKSHSTVVSSSPGRPPQCGGMVHPCAQTWDYMVPYLALTAESLACSCDTLFSSIQPVNDQRLAEKYEVSSTMEYYGGRPSYVFWSLAP